MIGICSLLNYSGRRPLLALAPLALGLAAAAGGCNRAAPPPVEHVRPVKTMAVVRGAETSTRSFSGRTEAAREVDMAFQVPGLLATFPAREGQRVAAGAVIATLRPDEFSARKGALDSQRTSAQAVLRALRAGSRPEERLRLESQVRAAEAKLQNARAEFDRYSELIRENAVARSTYELAETDYRVAQENLKAAIQTLEQSATARSEDVDAKEAEIKSIEARLAELTIQYDDSTLRAPFDGVVAQRFVEANQNIRAGQSIVRFQDTEEVIIAMDVPQSVMATEFNPADMVKLVAEFGSNPGVSFPVTIREISQVADPATQTFKVRVTMKSPKQPQILPGMTASVSLTRRRAAGEGGRISIPLSALFKESGGEQIVWTFANSTISRRAVTVGAPSGSSIEIVSGLNPGDRIVIAGVNQIHDGMKVRELGDGLGGARP